MGKPQSQSELRIGSFQTIILVRMEHRQFSDSVLRLFNLFSVCDGTREQMSVDVQETGTCYDMMSQNTQKYVLNESSELGKLPLVGLGTGVGLCLDLVW